MGGGVNVSTSRLLQLGRVSNLVRLFTSERFAVPRPWDGFRWCVVRLGCGSLVVKLSILTLRDYASGLICAKASVRMMLANGACRTTFARDSPISAFGSNGRVLLGTSNDLRVSGEVLACVSGR